MQTAMLGLPLGLLYLFPIALAPGCGGDDLDAPDDCSAGELHIVHGSLDARIAIEEYFFSLPDAPSRLQQLRAGLWRWELRDLTQVIEDPRSGPTYCGGPVVTATLGGCFRAM
jgi:hypothetical protein